MCIVSITDIKEWPNPEPNFLWKSLDDDYPVKINARVIRDNDPNLWDQVGFTPGFTKTGVGVVRILEALMLIIQQPLKIYVSALMSFISVH